MSEKNFHIPGLGDFPFDDDGEEPMSVPRLVISEAPTQPTDAARHGDLIDLAQQQALGDARIHSLGVPALSVRASTDYFARSSRLARRTARRA